MRTETHNPSLKERFTGLFEPGFLLLVGIYHYFMVVLETIFKDGDPLSLFNLSDIGNRSFARMWLKNGPLLSLTMPPKVETLLGSIHGVVLDLGPGTGTQLHRFNPNNVQVVYAAEPGTKMHSELAANAKKAGFGDKYRILGCGAEPESLIPALAKEGLLKDGASQGIFDDIVCLRVLCGVPRPEETIECLYRLLKPGGRMIISEHVKNSRKYEYGSYLGNLFQSLYALCGWSTWMGGCDLQRDTGAWFLRAGSGNAWSKSELEYINGWAAIPYVIGCLTKASN